MATTGDGNVTIICTGTVISPRLILTAGHCLTFRDPQTGVYEPIVLSNLQIALDYLTYQRPPKLYDLEVKPVEEGKDVDYMVLVSKVDIPLADRIVPAIGQDPNAKAIIYIIHTPDGHVLTYTEKDCRVGQPVIDPDIIHFDHTCDTDPASSGAPVFDQDFRLIGIHTTGGRGTDPDGRGVDPKTPNKGVLLSLILKESPMVGDALKRNGKQIVFGAKPPLLTQDIKLYQLSNGARVNQTDHGWVITGPGNGGVTASEPLVLQRGGDEELILWDQTEDWLYSIPKSGGVVRRRHSVEAAWTEYTTATKE